MDWFRKELIFDVYSMCNLITHPYPSNINIMTAFRHVLRVGRIIGKGGSMCKVSIWFASEIRKNME